MVTETGAAPVKPAYGTGKVAVPPLRFIACGAPASRRIIGPRHAEPAGGDQGSRTLVGQVQTGCFPVKLDPQLGHQPAPMAGLVPYGGLMPNRTAVTSSSYGGVLPLHHQPKRAKRRHGAVPLWSTWQIPPLQPPGCGPGALLVELQVDVVDRERIERSFLPCDSSVLPLDERPKAPAVSLIDPPRPYGGQDALCSRSSGVSGGAAGDRTPGLHTASVTLIPTELLPR